MEPCSDWTLTPEFFFLYKRQTLGCVTPYSHSALWLESFSKCGFESACIDNRIESGSPISSVQGFYPAVIT